MLYPDCSEKWQARPLQYLHCLRPRQPRVEALGRDIQRRDTLWRLRDSEFHQSWGEDGGYVTERLPFTILVECLEVAIVGGSVWALKYHAVDATTFFVGNPGPQRTALSVQHRPLTARRDRD